MKFIIPALILIALLLGLAFFPATSAVPIAMGAISMILSVYTLWITRLSPSCVKGVQTGRVIFSKNPNALMEPNGTLAISVQLIFSNSGSRLGHVDLLGIKLMGPNRDSWVGFRGLLEHQDEEMNWGREIGHPKMSPFNSFPVRPGETVSKTILFVQIAENGYYRCTEGRYTVKPYFNSIESGLWCEISEFDVDLNADDVMIINSGAPVQQADGRYLVNINFHNKPTRQQDEKYKNFNELRVE